MHLLLYSRYSLLAAALQGISLQKLPVFSNAFLSLKQLTTIYLLQQPQTVTHNSYQPPLLSTHPQCRELSGLWRFAERGYRSDLHLESIG